MNDEMEKIAEVDARLIRNLDWAKQHWKKNKADLKEKQESMALLIRLRMNLELPTINTREDWQAYSKFSISYDQFFEKIQKVEKTLSKLAIIENIEPVLAPHKLRDNILNSNLQGLIHKEAADLQPVESREKQTLKTINRLKNTDELIEQLSDCLNPTVDMQRAQAYNFIRNTTKIVQVINGFTARIEAIIAAAQNELDLEYRNYIRYSQTGVFMEESLRNQWFVSAVSPVVEMICIHPDLLNTFGMDSFVTHETALLVVKHTMEYSMKCSTVLKKLEEFERILSPNREYSGYYIVHAFLSQLRNLNNSIVIEELKRQLELESNELTQQR